MILLKENLKQVYKCQVLNVIDGDTVDVWVNFGLGFFCNARIRLKGIDAPEIKKVKKTSEEYAKGQVAKGLLNEWLNGKKDKVYLSAESRDLYGRWIGEIWKEVGQESLNDYMINKFYKTTYKPWYHQEPLKRDHLKNGNI